MKEITQGAAAGDEPELQARYAYYRRCRQLRKNGTQCKGPALKDKDLCYAHQSQAEANARRQEFRRSLGVLQVGQAALAWPAIGQVLQALIEGRVDERTARPVLIEITEALSGRRS